MSRLSEADEARAANQISDADYCRARRDLEMARAWRAHRNKAFIYMSMCASEARSWNHALLRVLRMPERKS